ncbi:Ankyrin-1 [Bienertia sinuspersici]
MENIMASLLLIAARDGDVEFLIESLTSQSIDYFYTRHKTDEGEDHYNIIHLAIMDEQADFLKQALDILPIAAVQLLCQEVIMFRSCNAYHFAALRGNLTTVKILVDSMVGVGCKYKETFAYGPCMSLDIELLCNMIDNKGISPLLQAVRRRCEKVAVKILTSCHSYSTSGDDDLSPLDVVPNCSEEVCKLLLDKHLKMIKKVDENGITLLHKWVMIAAYKCTQGTVKIAQVLVKAYVDAYEEKKGELLQVSPWKRENIQGHMPFLTALIGRHEKLALYIMSVDIENLVIHATKSVLYAAVWTSSAWIEACKRGHLQGIEAFINYSPDFRTICVQEHDSPLPHIHLRSYNQYQAFLAIPLIQEMINMPDTNNSTPLHGALEKRDMLFAEVLLSTDNVSRSIKDTSGQSFWLIEIQALYGTLLAFMTGVFTIISRKSSWGTALVSRGGDNNPNHKDE